MDAESSGKFCWDQDIHQVSKYHPTDYPHRGTKETSLEKSGGQQLNKGSEFIITPNGTMTLFMPPGWNKQWDTCNIPATTV